MLASMRLHTYEWGDPQAPPLVCLHGVTAHGLRFRKLAEERLADRFHVVALDLRGHGRSEWEPPWRCEQYAVDVVDTLDALGIETATVLGHSFGGRVIAELGAVAPERVERAIFLDPALHVLPHVALDNAEDQRRERAFASVEEAIAWRSALPGNPREFVVEDMEQHLVRGDDGLLRQRYSQACVVYLYADVTVPPPPPERLRVPTLLLYAPAFGLVREDILESYESALGDLLTVVTVPGGHMVLWEDWQLTADAVEDFLAATAAPV
jgi:lipase